MRAHLRGDGAGLERLAVVLQDLVVDGVAGFRPQMARELAGGIHLDADGALAVLEDFDGFRLWNGSRYLNCS